jgi:hypothetical protein
LFQVYGTASITSEEDEMMKKEREIIEMLEKEERWRYSNNTTSEEKDIGEEGNNVFYCTSFTSCCTQYTCPLSSDVMLLAD